MSKHHRHFDVSRTITGFVFVQYIHVCCKFKKLQNTCGLMNERSLGNNFSDFFSVNLSESPFKIVESRACFEVVLRNSFHVIFVSVYSNTGIYS